MPNKKELEELEKLFADPMISTEDIYERFGDPTILPWNTIQKMRREYRAKHDLPPMPRGPKPKSFRRTNESADLPIEAARHLASDDSNLRPAPVKAPAEDSEPMHIVVTHKWDEDQLELIERMFFNLFNK